MRLTPVVVFVKEIGMMNHSGNRSRFIFLLILLMITAAGLFAAVRYESSRSGQERDASGAELGRLRTMEWEGVTYYERKDVSTILVIGTDQTVTTQRVSSRSGGQADFLMLLVLDNRAHEVRMLNIDRDTMTSVQVYGILGEKVNRSLLQICLSHAYGNTEQESCENTIDAVSMMLGGIGIDDYISLDLGNIGRFNNALGGVTVTLEDDDLAPLDPAMVKGAKLKLTDEQAELLVHSRMSVGDGTNDSRMRRQEIYLRGAVSNIRSMFSDKSKANEMFLKMEPFFTTSMSRGRFINVSSQASGYSLQEPVKLAGEHTVNEEGYVEFHLAEGETERWLTKNIFKRQ